MIFAKVDVRLRDHLRAHHAAAAMSTWLWGLLYTREHELDGHIPDIAIRLAWVGEDTARAHSAVLVACGLWEKTEDGWRICRYAEKGNDTRDSISVRKAESRDRMARVRANRQRTSSEPPANKQITNVEPPELRQSEVPGSGSGSGSGSKNENGEPPPDEGGAQVRYAEAYVRGIATGKGGAYVWPGTQYAQWDLNKAITAFAKVRNSGVLLRGEKLLGWVEAAAEDFARFVVESGDDPKFWSGFDPKGFVRFLNQSDRTEEARRVG